ncbi:hypothetical protein [uncultured Pseudoteredinibacter sp.]|uniref:hypothetical protein n=1 Tax=uncultured Pseudoteredinibacter sp. TaxID=1641701 RepID=UPI00262CFCE2|nr:hypothetical protein [uncultured Pseudoteredinibacter sp.]
MLKRIFLLLVALSNYVFAESNKVKPEILWLQFDFPPYEIASGNDKNQGQIDRIRSLIIDRLPQYRHQKPTLVNQARMDRLMLQNNSCHMGMLKPKNPKPHLIYSKPHMTGTPHHIIASEKSKDRFYRNNEAISLRELLKEGELLLSVPSRSMGNVLNGIFSEYQQAISIRESSNVGVDFFTLIDKGRIDYTIEYPPSITRWNQNHPDNKLIAIPIQELSAYYPIGYAACSNSALGKKVIRDINHSFENLLQSTDYIKNYLLYLYPKNLHPQLQQQYENSVFIHYDFTRTPATNQPRHSLAK